MTLTYRSPCFSEVLLPSGCFLLLWPPPISPSYVSDCHHYQKTHHLQNVTLLFSAVSQAHRKSLELTGLWSCSPPPCPPPRCLSHFLAAALPLQLSTAHCWNHFLANTLSFPALWPFLVCTWQPLKSARTPPLPCGCSCIGCCIGAPLPALSSCFTVQACCRIRLVKKPDFGFIVSVLHLIITESCHLEVLEFDVYIESLLFPSSFLFLLFSLVPGFGCFVSSLFLWSVFSPANARGKPR